MKKLSVCIPCYNEVDNITAICKNVEKVLIDKLTQYDYEIVIIDNGSTDGTRKEIKLLTDCNKKVKAILNTRNFGPVCSPVYGMMACSGDCVIQMAADFQDPPELIPVLVKQWENGYKIVIAKKDKSDEKKIMYFIRSMYYSFMKNIADIEHIEHFTGFGLYDHSFVDILNQYDDPIPYLRGIVCETGLKRTEICFHQPQRKKGKTKTNFYSLYDFAMLGITSYSKILLRLATMLGFVLSALSLIISLVYLGYKIIYWNDFAVGTAPVLIGLFAFSSVQLFFIGLLGEYILNINTRIMHRPLVIEEKRINFD